MKERHWLARAIVRVEQVGLYVPYAVNPSTMIAKTAWMTRSARTTMRDSKAGMFAAVLPILFSDGLTHQDRSLSRLCRYS